MFCWDLEKLSKRRVSKEKYIYIFKSISCSFYLLSFFCVALHALIFLYFGLLLVILDRYIYIHVATKKGELLRSAALGRSRFFYLCIIRSREHLTP